MKGWKEIKIVVSIVLFLSYAYLQANYLHTELKHWYLYLLPLLLWPIEIKNVISRIWKRANPEYWEPETRVIKEPTGRGTKMKLWKKGAIAGGVGG